MAKFKVGDIVVPKPEADYYYRITNKTNHFKGRVVDIRNYNDLIVVKTLETTHPFGNLQGEHAVDSKHFELFKGGEVLHNE